ncbi:MAG: hypothetical protein Kow0037_04040 [Calditrichia bacterium]
MIQKFEKTRLNNNRNFWAYNFKTQSFYLVEATLRRTGSLSRIWVENQSWNSGYLNDSVLDNLLNGLEVQSGPNSINPSLGIFSIDTLLFGAPPDVDNNQYIDVLLLDIQDDFNGSTQNSYYAGYFSPTDQITDPAHPNYSVSNRADLIYLDTYPAIYYNQNYNLKQVLSTTAHEFQHLIHYRYDPAEAVWVNESMSELAGTYCGYGLDNVYLYLQETNINLTQFTNQVKDYARVNLWGLYLAEQLGIDFIKKLVQNPAKGILGIESALGQVASPLDFQTLFKNWAICNLVNDTLQFREFGYKHPEALNVHIQPERLIHEYPVYNLSGYVNEWGISYHRFRGSDSLIIQNNSGAQSIWVSFNPTKLSIFEQIPFSFKQPQFSEEENNWLIFYSNGETQFYKYNASAKYSLLYYEMLVDDGEANSGIHFSNVPATAAVQFTSPNEPLFLESLLFWSRDNGYVASGKVLSAKEDGFPGNVISPVKEEKVGTRNYWVEINFRGEEFLLDPLTMFFAGVEVPVQNVALGLDIDSPYLNRSFVHFNGNWRRLSDAGSFSGNWMIRARLSRLVPSDSLNSNASGEELKILSVFPNPALNGNDFQTEFYAPEAGYLNLYIYDVLGREVKKIKTPVNSGRNTYRLKLRTAKGSFSSGIYFLRMTLASPTRVRQSNTYKFIVTN